MELREIQRRREAGPRSETGPMAPHIEEVLLDGSYGVVFVAVLFSVAARRLERRAG